MCDFLDLTCCDAEKKRVCSERTENQHPTTVEVKRFHHKTLDLVGWFHGLEQWQEMATQDLPEVFFPTEAGIQAWKHMRCSLTC